MKVYKLVSKANGKLLSYNICDSTIGADGKRVLEYFPGKITRPKFGKLFAFDSIENAASFSASYKAEIWEATAAVQNITTVQSCYFDWHAITDFWKSVKLHKKDVKNSLPHYSNKQFLPHGTVLCSHIKLIRRVVCEKIITSLR